MHPGVTVEMSTSTPGPRTIAQKIIARAAGRDHVDPDEVLWVDVDLAMMHDSSGPRRIRPAMDELGVGVWDADRIVLVCDHYVPANTVAAAEILQTTRDFASTFGIERFHEARGYDEWAENRSWLFGHVGPMMAEFIGTFKEFPPSQESMSLELGNVSEMINSQSMSR